MKKLNFKNVAVILVILFIIGGFIRERKSNQDNNKATPLVKANALQSLVGKLAPAFTLTDSQGKAITNETLKGKKVVLFFNEGLACYPACWDQMIQLNTDDRLKKDDTVIYSVVTDTKDKWQQAATKMTDLAKVNIAFDNGKASKDFGTASAPSSMHAGAPGHSYVIIDKDGIVRWVLDDPKMAINNGEVFYQLGKLQ